MLASPTLALTAAAAAALLAGPAAARPFSPPPSLVFPRPGPRPYPASRADLLTRLLADRPLVQHDRRVTLIDPSSGSYNFSGVLRTQALCDRPCKPLVDIQSVRALCRWPSSLPGLRS